MAAARRFEPEIMAHADIMDDPVAIAEGFHRAQQARGRLVETVVVGGGDPLAVGGQHDVPDGQHRALAMAGDVAHFPPAFAARGKRLRTVGDEGCGHEADEHPVDIRRINRLARQAVARLKVRKAQRDDRVFGRADRVIPQSDIPNARRAARIPALDRQRRPVRLVERDDATRTPAKGQDGARIIAVGRIAQQGVIEHVLARPDQSCEFALVVEFAVDPQRVGRGGDDACHHGAGEIDGPEPRIEPLDRVLVLPVATTGEPEGHEFWVLFLK